MNTLIIVGVILASIGTLGSISLGVYLLNKCTKKSNLNSVIALNQNKTPVLNEMSLIPKFNSANAEFFYRQHIALRYKDILYYTLVNNDEKAVAQLRRRFLQIALDNSKVKRIYFPYSATKTNIYHFNYAFRKLLSEIDYFKLQDEEVNIDYTNDYKIEDECINNSALNSFEYNINQDLINKQNDKYLHSGKRLQLVLN